MCFVYLVGDKHQFGVFVRVHVVCQQFLVLRPCAARNDHFLRPRHKLFHDGYLFCVSGYLVHAVKSCVAGHGGMVDSVCLQQCHRGVVLHIDMRKIRQQSQIGFAPRQEEQLFGSEYGGYAVGRHFLPMQFRQIGGPELVFHEYRHAGLHQRHKRPCFAYGGKGQIGHQVYLIVVLAQAVAGRREESEQNFLFRMFPSESFYDGPCLFKFAYRCGMYPHRSVESVFFFIGFYFAQCFSLSPHQQ